MLKILYICTHNRCRSILSEAITNEDSQHKIMAKSAGSDPAGVIHPLSLQYLVEAGYSTADLKSQSWEEFKDFNPDFVITVCDSAAQQSCPLWFGRATQLYWELADPSILDGTEEQKRWAFNNTIDVIKKRVALLVEYADLSHAELTKKLLSVGAILTAKPSKIC
ncbi:arsenate reductase ArsC [Aliiglaciecola litoralis]|uniref:Arsenate reductase ArsC n=1 Tax=Aliiglaciecola litoralis TaxID=582857 RepID=A0ABP3WTP2_9ALTE